MIYNIISITLYLQVLSFIQGVKKIHSAFTYVTYIRTMLNKKALVNIDRNLNLSEI